MRDRHHVAHLGAVIDGDHPVLFHQLEQFRRARKAALLRVGIDGIGQIAPVDQIVADRVSPVLARVFRRVGLRHCI